MAKRVLVLASPLEEKLKRHLRSGGALRVRDTATGRWVASGELYASDFIGSSRYTLELYEREEVKQGVEIRSADRQSSLAS